MIAPEELTRIVEQGEGSPEETFYAVTLGDGEPLLALAETVSAFAAAQSGAPVDFAAIEQFADWLESRLAADEGARDHESLTSLFRPFLSPAAVLAFLDDPSFEPSAHTSLDVGSALTYAEAVIATWGPSAAAISRVAAGEAPRALQQRLEREVLAVCGTCAVPIALAVFPLEAEAAYGVVSSLALTVEQVRARLLQPATDISDATLDSLPLVAHLRAELDRLTRQKLSQLRLIAAELPAGASRNASSPDRFAALAYVGALLELRAESVDLADDLGQTFIAKHRFQSPASKLGLVDPLVIDQTGRLEKLKTLQPKIDGWITDTLGLAAREPTNASIDHKVDRIAVLLGAIRTQLSIIRVTEALIDDGNPDLWKDLEPTATNIDNALEFLTADVDYEKAKKIVGERSQDAALLVRSYKWSRIVLRAIIDASEVILAIESGSRLGGVGPSLRTQLATAGAVRTSGAAITGAEIDRLLAGATIVAIAASKVDPTKSRKKGIKAEKGIGLKPDRPREDIGSITGTASARYPDRLLIRFKTFWEVKNVLNLRLTRQLTDFILYAQATGLKLVLYIRPSLKGAAKAGTKLSPSLRDALKILKREGLIEIRYLKVH